MDMKRIYTYIALLLALVSCNKEESDIILPSTQWGGYITFSTDVETKTPINKSMRGKEFGVLAYSYESNWATARPVSIPDWFYNQLVSCDVSGICTYDADSEEEGVQLKEWNLSKIYSFFAYYPTNHDQISLVTGADDVDMPKVTYTYPFEAYSPDYVIPVPENDNLVDLMTASSIDQTGRGSGKVGFNFEHRLFCFEILANNYNDDKTIPISNLKLTLEGLEYDTITVPLMASDTKTKVQSESINVPSAVTYKISDDDTTVEIPSFEEGGTDINLSENCSSTQDGYIMLIPQDKPITGEFTWDDMPEGPGVTTSFTTSLDFQAGKKYSIIINFAGEAITIAIIEAGSWTENSVNVEFE